MKKDEKETGSIIANTNSMALKDNDKSFVIDKTVCKFVDNIRSRQEFFGVSKHASSAIIK